MINQYEKAFADDFARVFSPVEKVDIFRIIVCKWFGGIVSDNPPRVLGSPAADRGQYGDIDTKPLRHPYTWIQSSDISEWKDELNGKSYGLDQVALNRLQQVARKIRPINAIWGIECDTEQTCIGAMVIRSPFS